MSIYSFILKSGIADINGDIFSEDALKQLAERSPEFFTFVDGVLHGKFEGKTFPLLLTSVDKMDPDKDYKKYSITTVKAYPALLEELCNEMFRKGWSLHSVINEGKQYLVIFEARPFELTGASYGVG